VLGEMYKTKFCLLPRRLARHIKDAPPDKPNMEFIGWVWMQRAHLTRNLNHGWVAFLDSELLSEAKSKSPILLDAAQLLDDCLVRIYPEEFTKEHIEEVTQRFRNGGGTIARIAKMADKLRKI